MITVERSEPSSAHARGASLAQPASARSCHSPVTSKRRQPLEILQQGAPRFALPIGVDVQQRATKPPRQHAPRAGLAGLRFAGAWEFSENLV